MKSFIVLAVIVATALAAPANPDADAVILKQENNNIGVEGYSYESETSNGISQQEQGQLQNPGSENEAMEVRGQYSYVGEDGITYTVTYTAGVAGFVPQGAHIPQ